MGGGNEEECEEDEVSEVCEVRTGHGMASGMLAGMLEMAYTSGKWDRHIINDFGAGIIAIEKNWGYS